MHLSAVLLLVFGDFSPIPHDQDINETQGVSLDYPIISDPSREVALLYGMLDPDYLDNKGIPLTVRSVFFIDPKKKVRLM